MTTVPPPPTEDGCGLFFCEQHLGYGEVDAMICDRCMDEEPPHEPTPDVPSWLEHKLTDQSWQRWRDRHPEQVDALRLALTT